MKSFTYTFPEGSYRVPAGEPAKTIVARDVAPGLIITGSNGIYCVTHKPSGRATSKQHSTLREAKEAAIQLAALANWDRPHDELHRDFQCRGEDFRKSLITAGGGRL